MKRWIIMGLAIVVVLGAFFFLAGCSQKADDGQGSMEEVENAVKSESKDEMTSENKDGIAMENKDEMASSEHEYKYTCPMHPEVKQDKPGKCPECGMFLQADTDDSVEYYCSMCKGDAQDKPGKCSKCGMFLQAKPKSE